MSAFWSQTRSTSFPNSQSFSGKTRKRRLDWNRKRRFLSVGQNWIISLEVFFSPEQNNWTLELWVFWGLYLLSPSLENIFHFLHSISEKNHRLLAYRTKKGSQDVSAAFICYKTSSTQPDAEEPKGSTKELCITTAHHLYAFPHFSISIGCPL